MWIALWIAGAGAECPGTVSDAELRADLDAAESAYQSLDLEGFRFSLQQALGRVPCLNERVLPSTAAALHRGRGLDAFVLRELDVAGRSFAAARLSDPDYRFPVAVAPVGSPILRNYQSYELGEARTAPIEVASSSVQLYVDGSPGTEFRPDLPQLFQVIGPSSFAVLLEPGDALPLIPAPERPARRGHARPALIGGALAAAGLAVGAQVVGRSRKNALIDGGGTFGDVKTSVRSSNQLFNGLTIGLAVVGGGLGVGAIAVRD